MALETVKLLITCPDSRGIIAAVTAFIAQHDGNILDADQHTDAQHGEFFMRVEVERAGFRLTRETFPDAWTNVAQRFNMRWRVFWGHEVKRMAILVSKESHCLSDLLWRWKMNELPVDIPFVASNHEDLREMTAMYGIPFHVLPVTADNRAAQEKQLESLLVQARVDFVVLARYMQVLSSPFVARHRERIINIHHSFLPAFAGPRPYQQAFDRGVKLIGATSHYITDELDQGPIIAQATLPIGHRDHVTDLVRKGRDLERVVLANAVRLHVEDKILVSQNKTIVFD